MVKKLADPKQELAKLIAIYIKANNTPDEQSGISWDDIIDNEFDDLRDRVSTIIRL